MGDKLKEKCTICGDEFEIDSKYSIGRKTTTCSNTCRGHHYRNLADTKKIKDAILNKTTDKLKCSLKRVLDLGFSIEITE